MGGRLGRLLRYGGKVITTLFRPPYHVAITARMAVEWLILTTLYLAALWAVLYKMGAFTGAIIGEYFITGVIPLFTFSWCLLIYFATVCFARAVKRNDLLFYAKGEQRDKMPFFMRGLIGFVFLEMMLLNGSLFFFYFCLSITLPESAKFLGDGVMGLLLVVLAFNFTLRWPYATTRPHLMRSFGQSMESLGYELRVPELT